MRPELDDFEELSDDAPRSRAMSWLVLVVAVGGFAALAYYAYHSGSQSMQDGQVLVVQADRSPIKQAPSDPQGEAFPNQEKTIYDAIAPTNGARRVEKLLPEPEEAVIPEPAVQTPRGGAKGGDTTTFVNESLARAEQAIDPVDAQSMKQPAPAIAPESKKPAATSVEPTDDAPLPATQAAPAMVNVKPTAPAARPAAPAPAASTGGAYKVQLGAFKSDAEARQQWSKITAKHGDVVKGAPIVVKAELPNGTFYRLRASGFASAEAAKAACATLGARGQACFPAGK